jgi:hypothetical protein
MEHLPGTATRGGWKALLLQLVVFAAVGGVFNVFYGGLYLLLREGFSAQWANAIAQTLGLVLLGFGLAVTAGSLWLLQVAVDRPSRTAELVVLVAANLGVGLVRFAAFRAAMVPDRPRADHRAVV